MDNGMFVGIDSGPSKEVLGIHLGWSRVWPRIYVFFLFIFSQIGQVSFIISTPNIAWHIVRTQEMFAEGVIELFSNSFCFIVKVKVWAYTWQHFVKYFLIVRYY